MATDNCTELPTVASSTDAAHSTTSLVCDPPGNRTADIDDRHAADSNEYDGVEWSRPSLRGYTRSKSSALKTSWIWDYGWRIDNKDGKEYWLCQECHRRKDHRNHLYRAGDQTTGGATHLKNVHGRIKEGLVASIKHSQAPGQQKLVGQRIGKKCKIADYFQLPQGTPAAVVNALAEMFDIHEFRSRLLRWIVFDHIPFKKVESDAFKDLLLFCNPLLAAELPSARTVSRWINSAFNDFQGVVTELLATALGLVHFSFDMWTSGNSLALLGVVVHFIDVRGKVWQFLLGLPHHHESHSGHNIAETFAAIAYQYNIQDRIGYFTTDNASNNDTCMEFLGDEFDFDHVVRRVRCVGHVLNLVAKAIMIGGGSRNEPDMDVFEQQLESLARDEREQLAQWRRRGPVGKLHNIVVWICRSPQRIEKFETLQRKAIDEGSQFTEQIYRLVHDNDTRWNSLFAMIERALKLRESIDEYIFKETAKWTEYEMRWQAKNSHRSKPPKKKKRPSILDDQLSADDWHTLSQYHRILKPLKEATMQLQGQVGRHGHIWEVLPIFQQLLEHLERVKDLYTIDNETEVSQAYPEAVELQQEHHFKFNVNLAWQKLNEYYERLDDTPVYTAALVLHPRYNWAWIQRHWNDRTDWIKNANVVLLKLWQQYSDLPNKFDDPTTRKRSSTPVQRPPKRARRQCYDIGDEEMKFAYSSEEDSPPVSMQDQWQEYTSQRSDKSVHDPYAWWWSTRHRWPQLAMMALDILTVAPMSDEPERQFSDTGMMVTNRRNRLRSDTIAATMSLKSWTREGVISWTKADMKALTMNTGSNVTNATNVTNQSPSNQFAKGTNRPI